MTVAALEVVPLTETIGAEVRGVDLSAPLPDDIVASIRAAWLRHLVLVFRGQTLPPAAFVAFSARFGELDVAPPQEQDVQSPTGLPEIMIVSNVIENGRRIGNLGNGEAAWHTDMCYTDSPPMASVLYALEVPRAGGETSFLDMYEALRALPSDLRARCAGVRIKHDRTYTAVGELRRGQTPPADLAAAPGSIHPLIRTHRETGREALYLGRRLNAYAVGRDLAASEALLDELWGHTVRDPHVYRHDWRVGDVVMWDNRCTMHRREAFAQEERRFMLRTQIKETGYVAAS